MIPVETARLDKWPRRVVVPLRLEAPSFSRIAQPEQEWKSARTLPEWMTAAGDAHLNQREKNLRIVMPLVVKNK